MFISELAEHAANARRGGYRFVLVCYDSFDRLRGDDDLGYYYPILDTAAAVRNDIAAHRLHLGRIPPWADLNDVCEAVINLETAGLELTEADCVDPRQWLAANPPHPANRETTLLDVKLEP